MDNITFCSPKSFKNGSLIENKFRVIDIIILVLSIFISLALVIFYFLVRLNNFGLFFLNLVPAIIGATLVIPLRNYHNVLTYFKLLLNFANSNKTFIYTGVIYDYYKERR